MSDRTDITEYWQVVAACRHLLARPPAILPTSAVGDDGALYLLLDTGVSKVAPCDEDAA